MEQLGQPEDKAVSQLMGLHGPKSEVLISLQQSEIRQKGNDEQKNVNPSLPKVGLGTTDNGNTQPFGITSNEEEESGTTTGSKSHCFNASKHERRAFALIT